MKINNIKGFSLIEILVSVSIFIVFLHLVSSFLVVYIDNYLGLYKNLASINEIQYALDLIENNIYISDILINEPDYPLNESTISLGYYDEGVYKKVSYSLYQNKIRKKMNNISYLTTDDCNITGLKYYYDNKLITFDLKVKYGNYESTVIGKSVIPNEI